MVPASSLVPSLADERVEVMHLRVFSRWMKLHAATKSSRWRRSGRVTSQWRSNGWPRSIAVGPGRFSGRSADWIPRCVSTILTVVRHGELLPAAALYPRCSSHVGLTVCVVCPGYRQEDVRGDDPPAAGGFVTGEKHAVHLPCPVEAGIRHGRVCDEVGKNSA